VKEAKKGRQTLGFSRVKDRDQTFRASQLADRELMARQFERGQVIQGAVLIGGVAFDRVETIMVSR
jgi:hypothetical protein